MHHRPEMRSVFQSTNRRSTQTSCRNAMQRMKFLNIECMVCRGMDAIQTLQNDRQGIDKKAERIIGGDIIHPSMLGRKGEMGDAGSITRMVFGITRIVIPAVRTQRNSTVFQTCTCTKTVFMVVMGICGRSQHQYADHQQTICLQTTLHPPLFFNHIKRAEARFPFSTHLRPLFLFTD